MISTIISRLVILVFGTLYPAYASYKAVRTKNVKEYVKWMMYWIVFALFTCAETFTDVFLSWFPFYYEIKIILVLWLLSPATKGSSILYRKFVHPMLSRREQEIDDYIAKAKEQGYHTVLNLGTKGVNYATTVIMQTAIKGGGGIVNQLRKSYSLSDLTDDTDSRADVRGLPESEQSDMVDPRHVRRRHSPRRSASGSSRVDLYFPEVDVRPGPSLGHVLSTEEISSGYSSAEPLYVGQPPKLEPREGLIRTASVGGTSRPRTRTTRASLSTKKSTPLPEDSEESESDSEITVIHRISKASQKISRTIFLHEESESSENGEFVDTTEFPIESTSFKIQEIIENNPFSLETIQDMTLETIIEPETAELIIQPESEIETYIEVQIETESSLDSFEDTVEIIENKDDKTNENFTNKSLSTVIGANNKKESSVDIFEDTVDIKDDEKIVVDKINEDLVEESRAGENLFTENKTNEDSANTDEQIDKTSNENQLIESAFAESIDAPSSDIDLENLTSVSQRGGKYNKHVAPSPPLDAKEETVPEENPPTNLEPAPELAESISEVVSKNCKEDKEDIPKETAEEAVELNSPEIPLPVAELSSPSRSPEPETHSIKATLVLKPGIIKNIGPLTEESSKSQIFISQSPKTKRKTKSKHDNPISRLMMLPKKFFGSKESNSESLKEKEKRRSWNPDSRSLTPSSVEDLKSKSDTEDMYEPVGFFEEDKKAFSAVNIAEKRHEKNRMVLRTLSHSPKQYKKKIKKEDYNYEDSD